MIESVELAKDNSISGEVLETFHNCKMVRLTFDQVYAERQMGYQQRIRKLEVMSSHYSNPGGYFRAALATARNLPKAKSIAIRSGPFAYVPAIKRAMTLREFFGPLEYFSSVPALANQDVEHATVEEMRRVIHSTPCRLGGIENHSMPSSPLRAEKWGCITSRVGGGGGGEGASANMQYGERTLSLVAE